MEKEAVQVAPEVTVPKTDTKVVETIAQYLLDRLTCCSTGILTERIAHGTKRRAVNEPTSVRSMTLSIQDIMSGINWYCREQDPSSTVVPNNQLIRDVAVKFNELILTEKEYSCLAYLYRQEVKHVLAKGDLLSPVVALHQAAEYRPWVYDKLTAYAIRVTENGVVKYHGDVFPVKRKDDVHSATADVFEDNVEFVVAYYDPQSVTIMTSLIQQRLQSAGIEAKIEVVPFNLTFLSYDENNAVYQDKGINAFFIPKHMFTEHQSAAVIEINGDYSGSTQIENEHGIDLRLIGQDDRTFVYAASGLKGREDAPAVSGDLYDTVHADAGERKQFVFDRGVDVMVLGDNYTLYYVVHDTKDLREDPIDSETSIDDLLYLESEVRKYIDDHGHIYVTAHRLATDEYNSNFLPFKPAYYYLNHAYLTHRLSCSVPLTETHHSRRGNDYFVAITKAYGCDRDEAVNVGMPLMKERYSLSVKEAAEWLDLHGLVVPHWKVNGDYFHGALEICTYPVASEGQDKELFTNEYMLCVPKDRTKEINDFMYYLGEHPYFDFISVFTYALEMDDGEFWRKDYMKDIGQLIKREVGFTTDVLNVCPPVILPGEVIVSEDIHGNLYLSVEELPGLGG